MSRDALLALTVPERARTVPFVLTRPRGDIRLVRSLARSRSFNESGERTRYTSRVIIILRMIIGGMMEESRDDDDHTRIFPMMISDTAVFSYAMRFIVAAYLFNLHKGKPGPTR